MILTGSARRLALLLLAIVLIGASARMRPAQADGHVTRFEIGKSVRGRPLMIGALHGGYEANTAALMTRTLTYLSDNPALIPAGVTVYILPVANPDGLATARTVRGRVNANNVDLNRNWDYKWRADARFGYQPISGGSAPASEPETIALRDFLTGTLKLTQPHDAVVFYHSAYPAIFTGDGLTTTRTAELARAMSRATGYRVLAGVPGQVTTGNAIDYLTARAGITAIEIELSNKVDIDWPQNRRALDVLLGF
jgi:predicted deacylase